MNTTTYSVADLMNGSKRLNVTSYAARVVSPGSWASVTSRYDRTVLLNAAASRFAYASIIAANARTDGWRTPSGLHGLR